MIHVPTAPWAHTAFDLAAWSCGLALSALLYRWRLQGLTAEVAGKVGGGYFAALALGAIPGAWLAGSVNTLRAAHPALSHSVVGALVGAIVGVEIYKAIRGVRGSTGGVFVGPFALGVAVGRWGCLFAGLPDGTYGLRSALGHLATDRPPSCRSTRSMAVPRSPEGLAAGRGRCARLLRSASGTARAVSRGFLKPYPPLSPLNLFHVLTGLVHMMALLPPKPADDHAEGRALPVPGQTTSLCGPAWAVPAKDSETMVYYPALPRAPVQKTPPPTTSPTGTCRTAEARRPAAERGDAHRARLSRLRPLPGP